MRRDVAEHGGKLTFDARPDRQIKEHDDVTQEGRGCVAEHASRACVEVRDVRNSERLEGCFVRVEQLSDVVPD